MPWYLPQKYLDRYPLDAIVLPEVPDDDLNDVPEAGLAFANAGHSDLEAIKKAGKWKHAVRAYLASITAEENEDGGDEISVLTDLENEEDPPEDDDDASTLVDAHLGLTTRSHITTATVRQLEEVEQFATALLNQKNKNTYAIFDGGADAFVCGLQAGQRWTSTLGDQPTCRVQSLVCRNNGLKSVP